MATFTVLSLQGIIIDTDHWRHFFLLLGLIWGFIAAISKWSSSSPADLTSGPPRRRKADSRPKLVRRARLLTMASISRSTGSLTK